MNFSRSIALLSLGASLLGAQHVDRLGASAGGRLQAELHFVAPGDAWFSTNEPAYVAIFEVFRSGVRQLYPTFSAQAAMTTGAYRRVDLMLSPPLPSVLNPGLGTSLVSITSAGTSAAGGWPRMLLLVASTSPLRVDNWSSSSLALNQQLFGQRHWTDVQTDEGIDALVQLVRPLDPSAEVAIDRVDAISQPVFATTMLAYDPNTVALRYDCWDAGQYFISPAPLAGAFCVGLRNLPVTIPGRSGTAVTAATVATAARPDTAQVHPAKATISENRVISDPAEIRRMVDQARASRAGTPAVHPGPNSSASQERSAELHGRNGDPVSPTRAEVAPPRLPSASPSAREWKNPPTSAPATPRPAISSPPPAGTVVPAGQAASPVKRPND